MVLATNFTGEGLREAFNPKDTLENPLEDPKRFRKAAPHKHITGKHGADGGFQAAVSSAAVRDVDTLMSVRGLTVSFGDQVAVRGIDLDIARGEVVALVGESGSGKSLTALSMVGLLPPNARLGGLCISPASHSRI